MPIELESSPMPSNDSRRLDDEQCLEAARPKSIKPNPEDPVTVDQMESAGSLAPEHAQLMAQGKDLKLQVRCGTKDGNDQTEDSKSDCKHIGDDRAAHPTAPCFLRRTEFTTGTTLAPTA